MSGELRAGVSSQNQFLPQQNKFYPEQNKLFPTARVDSGQKPEFARVFLVQGKGIEGEGQDEKMGGGTQRKGVFAKRISTPAK